MVRVPAKTSTPDELFAELSKEAPHLASYPIIENVETGSQIGAILDGGYIYPFAAAPIDMKAGDVCTINLNNREVVEVQRGGGIIYPTP
jgi:hypothetical protein